MSVSVQSIQDKLRNIARAGGKDFQLILTRYFQERLLYRLSQSRHYNNLCLKGGALLYALEGEESRPTLDIDFLSMKIRMDKERFIEIFREICSIAYEDDGVQFDTGQIRVEEIMEQNRYAGLQVRFPASLGSMKQVLRVDIGFGDVAIPEMMVFPTLLEMAAPEIMAYSPETVIAEKFEAMIDLAESNSRMKDFYDVYQLLSKGRIETNALQEAVRRTFENRGTALRRDHSIFQPDFSADPDRNHQWKRFLERTKLDTALSFSDVMEVIKAVLRPE